MIIVVMCFLSQPLCTTSVHTQIIRTHSPWSEPQFNLTRTYSRIPTMLTVGRPRHPKYIDQYLSPTWEVPVPGLSPFNEVVVSWPELRLYTWSPRPTGGSLGTSSTALLSLSLLGTLSDHWVETLKYTKVSGTLRVIEGHNFSYDKSPSDGSPLN